MDIARVEKKINNKYSYKSFKRQNLSNRSPDEFNNTEIIGSCFFQDEINTVCFPAITGVTFTRCNLDNAVVPAGNTVNGGTHKNKKVQNDGEWWVVDSDGKPIEPQSPEQYDALGLSKDPKDLPDKPLDESVIMKVEKEKEIEDIKTKFKEIAKDDALIEAWIAKGGYIGD